VALPAAGDAQAKGADAVLRDILSLVVDEARITAPGSHAGGRKHATWAKAKVKWTANVDLLLASGTLTLEDEPESIAVNSVRERKREAQRRYRARKKELGGQEKCC
jgi:hypothetical protein